MWVSPSLSRDLNSSGRQRSERCHRQRGRPWFSAPPPPVCTFGSRTCSPSGADTTTESCLALLPLLFHIAPREGAEQSSRCCQRWLSGCQLPLAACPSCRDAAAKARRQEGRERHLESWSGTKGARNSKRGELFKEEHQSVGDGERAANDRSGLKSHLSPSSCYVNYHCSLAAANAEVIANIFQKHLLWAKAPGLLPTSHRGVGGRDVPCHTRAVLSLLGMGQLHR